MSAQRPATSFVASLPLVHSFPSPSRKRRAVSPTSPPLPDSWTTAQPSDLPQPEKRRRPNLANGFSGLSISRRRDEEPDSPLPTYEESLATKHEVDDGDALEQSPYEDCSEQPAQQADEIEQPDTAPRVETDLLVEDVTSQTPVRGRKRRDEEDDFPRKRPRGNEMDIDDPRDDREELGTRRRRRTQWHEPEKDREPSSTDLADESGIVITSLGSPSSSRSTSSERSSRHLTQPGYQGFTLSPSFLTHLLAAQRDQCDPRGSPSKSLTLYRPRIPLAKIVETWRGMPEVRDDAGPEVRVDDAGRFEEVDDVGESGDAESGDADMSMDVE